MAAGSDGLASPRRRFGTDGPGAELESAEQAWRLTLDHSPIGMALVGTNGEFLRVNHALSAMLGYPPERLLAMTFQQLTYLDDLAPDVALVEECLRGDRTTYRMVKRYLHADGHLVWGDLSVALVRDPSGEPMHFVSQILDVTEQRRARDAAREATRALAARSAELERSNRDLEHFAEVAAHDLQSPLTTVRGYLSLLREQRGHVFDDEAAGWYDRIDAAADRMSALINALLDYASTTSLAATDAVGPVDTTRVVSTALADLDPLIAGAQARIRVQPDLPPIIGSEPLLGMLVGNLVANSVKHRDPSRRCTVTITARQLSASGSASASRLDLDGLPPHDGGLVEWSADASPAMVALVVEDDGPGIPDEDKARVFELFERGTGPRASGHGIGMAQCRRIVEWHHGSILATDTPGGGLRITCLFPVAGAPVAGP